MNKTLNNFILRQKNSVYGILPKVTEQSRLTIPTSVLAVSWFMSISAVSQAIADYFLETAILFGWLGKIPFRLEFVFLTALSAILAAQSLNNIQKGSVDMERETLLVSLILELSLFISDLVFIFRIYPENPLVLYIRLPFLFLTGINILIVGYCIARLHLIHFGLVRKLFLREAGQN